MKSSPPARSRREDWERDRKLQTICLLIITVILLGAVAYSMSAVLIPFVLALFIFQLLDPMVHWLTVRGRCPHPLAVSVTLGLTVIAVVLASSLLTTSFGQLLGSADEYVRQMTRLITTMTERFPGLGERFRVLGQDQLEQLSASLGSLIATLTNSLIYMISQSTVVLLFLTFLLFGSRSHLEPLPGVLHDINQKVQKYVQVKTAISLATGAFAGTILWLLDIELALVFGLLTVVLNFIPNIGSILSTFLPLPIVLLSPNVSQAEALLAILLPGLVHFAIGNVLEPKLLGDTMDLSPVVVLLCLTVWTALWGGIGALLAVPITAIIQILCEKLDFTRPIAQVLRGNFLGLFEQPGRLSPDGALAAPPDPQAGEGGELP